MSSTSTAGRPSASPPAETVGNAALMLSELVTNAFRHTRGLLLG